MDSSSLSADIRDKIQAALPDITKLIVKENGDACSGSYIVVVVSASFEGQGPLDRQRRINEIIKDEIKRLHAITLKTWTPKQWETQRANYE
jgi:stress-induced morphogen